MVPAITGWIRKHQANRQDHEDLVQVALLALLAAAPRYDGSVSFKTFAWPRAIGSIYDYIRLQRPRGYQRTSRLKPGETVPVIASLDEPAGDGTGSLGDSIPAVQLETDPVELAELQAAISLLPIETRSILDLVAADDLPPSDVACMLGVSDATVSLTMGRARRDISDGLAHPLSRRKALRLLRSESFLRECVADGKTVRMIDEELGVNRSSVREWMRRHGVEPVRSP
jgi:RNA polymerase sigma factor (sigma-70 family)